MESNKSYKFLLSGSIKSRGERQTPTMCYIRVSNKALQRRKQLLLLREVMSRCSAKGREKRAFKLSIRQGGGKRQ